MNGNVFSVGENHYYNKYKQKNASKNQLSFTKHYKYFLANLTNCNQKLLFCTPHLKNKNHAKTN